MRDLRIFQIPAFARYFLGDTIVRLMEQCVQVALLWFLATRGHSPANLGWYVFWNTAPVIIGGPLTVKLFRYWSIRPSMVVDLVSRGLGYGVLTVVMGTHEAAVNWAVFDGVAAVNALTFMVTNAGGPNMYAQLLPAKWVSTALYSEQIGWNLAALLGPLLAGVMLNRVPVIFLVGSCSGMLIVAAYNLATISLIPRTIPAHPDNDYDTPRSIWCLIRGNPAIWISTAVFWGMNVAQGMLMVLWPLIVAQYWHAHGALYGTLLTLEAAGGLLGSILLPVVVRHGSTLRRLLGSDVAAGMAMLALWNRMDQPIWILPVIFVHAFLTAGAATWALQIRYEGAPKQSRPALMAYIRSFLQSAGPVGGLIAGMGWHSIGIHRLWQAVIIFLVVFPVLGLSGHRLFRETKPSCPQG
ncbi:MAG: hypothetical protein C7B47_14850 [Sulfobacillus thermosulfidooxidans]|uniref:MFS transporter n=1 Tax=Sulfobacillus thermosulfidooxidans TaxID=28034 RepID=A0A2T2WQC5_SULTH|nr:MAG: hypothetical protein C7B47_14850 [Sulfobacillus thermosulfidooxidans]